MACDLLAVGPKVSDEDAFESTTTGSACSRDFEDDSPGESSDTETGDYQTDDDFEGEVSHVTYKEKADAEGPYASLAVPQNVAFYAPTVTNHMPMAESANYGWMPQHASQSVSQTYSCGVFYGNYYACRPNAVQNMHLQPETFQGYSHMSGDFARHEVRQCSQGSQGRLRSPLQQHSAYLIRELEAG